MSQQHIEDIGSKIWDGDNFGPNGAVTRSHYAYQDSLKDLSDRIAWTTALYSPLGTLRPEAKRRNLTAIYRLAWCFTHLYPQIRYYYRNYLTPKGRELIQSSKPTQNEPIATYLLRWSELPIVGGVRYRLAAKFYASMTISQSRDNPPDGHTLALALETMAEILFLELAPRVAQERLAEAVALAAQATDLNQRARIYRTAARLWKTKFQHRDNAVRCMDDADAVPGIAKDVRDKNAIVRKELGL